MAKKLPKMERWKKALEDRDAKRQQLRDKVFAGTAIANPPAPAVVTPQNQMMVKRGTRVVPLDHQTATNTTAKSWPTRKQKFGKVGRQSKNTFKKTK
jgi:hypothetical protein